MARLFTLVDADSVEDVRTYLIRARAVDPDAVVRFQGVGGAVGVWTCVLAQAGLLDSTPTVLGLRTAGLGEASSLDAVVSVSAVLDRMTRSRDTQRTQVLLPPYDEQAAWAGISPSLSGWNVVGSVEAHHLVGTAKAGVEEVAQAVPKDSGREVVQRVRSAIWGRVSPWGSASAVAQGAEHDTFPDIPDAAAFAAWALGFLRSDDTSRVPVAVNASWLRLSCPGGFVLVRTF